MRFKEVSTFLTFTSLFCLNFANAETLTTSTSGDRHQEYNIFDVKALKDTTITGIQQNFADSANYLYEIWYKEGSASGTIPTSSDWIKIGSSSFTIDSSDLRSLTNVPFENFSIDLGKGKTYGFLVGGDPNDNDLFSEARSGTTRQTSTTGTLIGEVISSDSNLEIYEGAHASTDDGIDDPNNVYYYYNWNGGIIYIANPEIDPNAVKPYGSMQGVSKDSINAQKDSILAIAGECSKYGFNILDTKACFFSTLSNSHNSINGLDGFNVDNLNSNIALEFSPNDKYSGGFSYGYGSENLNDFAISKTSSNINSDYQFYSGYLVKKYPNNFNLKALIGFGDFDYSSKRYKNHTYANADYSSSIFTSGVKAVWEINSKYDYGFKPSFGFSYINNSQSEFNEKGSTHLLTVESNNSQSHILNFGLDLFKKLNPKTSKQFLPRLKVGYSYDLSANNDANRGVKAKLTNGSAESKRYLSKNYGSHKLKLDLGVDKFLSERLIISSNFGYSISNESNGYSYGGGFKYKF